LQEVDEPLVAGAPVRVWLPHAARHPETPAPEVDHAFEHMFDMFSSPIAEMAVFYVICYLVPAQECTSMLVLWVARRHVEALLQPQLEAEQRLAQQQLQEGLNEEIKSWLRAAAAGAKAGAVVGAATVFTLLAIATVLEID
jgi:hypothetical protein